MTKRSAMWAVVFGTGAAFALDVSAQTPAQAAATRTEAATEIPGDVRAIHDRAIVIDGHIDTPSAIIELGVDIGADNRRAGCQPGMPTYDHALPHRADGNYCLHFDLDGAKRGGLDAAFLSIWIDPEFIKRRPAEGGGAARRAFDMIAATRAAIEAHPDRAVMARSVADIRAAAASGKFAALLGIEGGHAIENSLEILRAFHADGVRYLTLTHSNTNDWADSSGDQKDPKVKRHGGLTDFGRDVVREMNRLGMLVDVSHVSDETFFDVIDVAKAPIIASHSSSRALTPHWRNVTDDMARAVAKNGGVVLVNFNEPFIGVGPDDLPNEARAAKARLEVEFPKGSDYKFHEWRLEHWPAAPLTRLVDHIDHLAKVAGVDHVGLGSDFDGVFMLPGGIDGVQDLPKISAELAKRGYSADDITKILGGNTLRVFEAVERYAASQRAP